MVAWNIAVISNILSRDTAHFKPSIPIEISPRPLASWKGVCATARARPQPYAERQALPAAQRPAAGSGQPTNASLVVPSCPCGAPPAPQKKVDLPPKKHAEPDTPKRISAKPLRQLREPQRRCDELRQSAAARLL
jgi:hypothetical protein